MVKSAISTEVCKQQTFLLCGACGTYNFQSNPTVRGEMETYLMTQNYQELTSWDIDHQIEHTRAHWKFFYEKNQIKNPLP